MRYTKLDGIILKKQNYKEADQIMTIWTKQAGKIRALARGVRLPKSKLVYSLQDLSLIEFEITGRTLPTIINVACRKQHQTLSQDLKKAAIAFYAAELVMKTTADEHPNAVTFDLLQDFLQNLDRLDYSVRYYPLLESFSLKLMESLGFSIEHADGSFQIPGDLGADLIDLGRGDMGLIQHSELAGDRIEQLHSLINNFIEYILERNIKSQAFLWTTKS